MNKIKVILDTQTDVREFVNIANSIDSSVYLEDDTGFRVDAKSLLGVMYGISEFESLYVLSDYEHISTKFNKFMV